ncbi:MAG: hypothetical protein ACKV19_01125 [Verrucomicrobiales bacterium]
MDTPTFSRRPLVAAVVLSFIVLLAAAWLRGGVAATSYDTQDSQGRTMGFNDVFSGEHYGILLANANWREMVKQLEPHDWGLVAAHIVLLELLGTASARVIRVFIWPQAVLFWWGWFGFWLLPIGIADALWFHTSDREGFTDIPYISILSQGAWFWACAFILWKLRPRRSPNPTISQSPSPVSSPAAPSFTPDTP